MNKNKIFLTILTAMIGLFFMIPNTEAQTKSEVKTEVATLAGGCFWCQQSPYDKLPGVIRTTVGYTGGTVPSPSYEAVCTGKTGHAEAVEIEFDPKKISYEKLLDVFWRNIDPTTENQQFFDHGSQYRTAIFYHNEAQREAAIKSKQKLKLSGVFDHDIVTTIEPAKKFYKAEAYHQGYYKSCPLQYNAYKNGSGRTRYFEKIWGSDHH